MPTNIVVRVHTKNYGKHGKLEEFTEKHGTSAEERVLGGYCVIFFGKKLILLYCDAYVCLAYIDVPKVHWQTIYCGKFTVEET